MPNHRLVETIFSALIELERRGEVVFVSPAPVALAEHIAEKVLEIVPSPDLSDTELAMVRGLLIHLASGVSYCEEDLPAVTGGTLHDFRTIALKLPME